jgi:hypothetical protein
LIVGKKWIKGTEKRTVRNRNRADQGVRHVLQPWRKVTWLLEKFNTNNTYGETGCYPHKEPLDRRGFKSQFLSISVFVGMAFPWHFK